MPTLSRSRSGSSAIATKGVRAAPAAGAASGAGGVTTVTTPIAASASRPVSAKIPPMPIAPYNSGAPTSDSAKVRPIDAPTSAIALVRCESRVLSAMNAVTAAEIAPAPCTARPRIVVTRSCAPAATKLPAANSSRPNTMTRLRPRRSEAMPNGICSRPCVSP